MNSYRPLETVFSDWFMIYAPYLSQFITLDDLPHLCYEIACDGLPEDCYLIERVEHYGDNALIIHQDRSRLH